MTTKNNNGYVTVQHHESIATIEFYHPQSNALPAIILSKLTNAIQAEAMNTAIKVIVLKSAGEKIFCSGASFDELLSINNEAQGLQFFSGFAQVINAMRKAPQLIVARIQGKCIGGGVGLAAAADYAIAQDTALVKLSELAVGIGPFVVGPAVERKLGLSAFSQLAINATTYQSATWAMQHGLFAQLHSTTQAMDESITQLTNTLANSSYDAMTALKKILWQDTQHWDELLLQRAAISGQLILSEDSKKFIANFKNK